MDCTSGVDPEPLTSGVCFYPYTMCRIAEIFTWWGAIRALTGSGISALCLRSCPASAPSTIPQNVVGLLTSRGLLQPLELDGDGLLRADVHHVLSVLGRLDGAGLGAGIHRDDFDFLRRELLTLVVL